MILIDDHAEIGGQLLHRGGVDRRRRLARMGGGRSRRASLASGGRVLTATTAFGVYDHNLVLRLGAARGRARRACGKSGRSGSSSPPARSSVRSSLPDNDRPGVMSADAALVYLRRYAVRVGERIAVATNNDSAYPVAEALAEAGAEVEIFDARAETPATQLQRDARRGRGRRGPRRRRGA